tara:strand:+ start:485 stop:688 length:204 start_codon:yes stop_codon:yes gene_type:complete
MKLPKVVKGKDVIKILIKYGYEIKRRKGSHVSLSKEGINITVVLPLTTIGVYRSIAKKTGISLEEFL